MSVSLIRRGKNPTQPSPRRRALNMQCYLKVSSLGGDLEEVTVRSIPQGFGGNILPW